MIFKQNKSSKEANVLGKCLVIGSGPVAFAYSFLLKKFNVTTVYMLSRASLRAEKLLELLSLTGGQFSSQVSDNNYELMEGVSGIDGFSINYEEFKEKSFDTIILCVPYLAYDDVVSDLYNFAYLTSAKRILLVSSGLGSGLKIKKVLSHNFKHINIVSLSNYFGATKLYLNESDNVTIMTKGMKKQICIAYTVKDEFLHNELVKMFKLVNVVIDKKSSTFESESRNITNYVHVPLFINKFSLDEIFSKSKSLKYMYKLFPEGPITKDSFYNMVRLHEEISNILIKLSTAPLSLLKFLNDDNYPVHEETISRFEIDNFDTFDETRKVFLLYVRYTALLIDPFSKPDEKGKYKDFSAVPFVNIKFNEDTNTWDIPRIPFEDYISLKTYYFLSEMLFVPNKTITSFLNMFETYCHDYFKLNSADYFDPLSTMVKDAQQRADVIIEELGT